ncbi:MFS general substrate transporter [Vararia minispora EC-137]|uniref:MFS general substrate transporter n=1 Tax=Vararia minispora EC-137 TaxID=1314806 RepID=A0ACB8QXQ9_9AGAM|nr:MFS general substrate transporter [Vararia minispora EC-137]
MSTSDHTKSSASIELPTLTYRLDDLPGPSASWKELPAPSAELPSLDYRLDAQNSIGVTVTADGNNVELGFVPLLHCQLRLNETELAPVDRGLGAWLYLVSIFVAGMMIWAFSVAWGVFLEAYLRDTTLLSQPHATALLPLIGNLSSGIMYLTSPVTYPLASRYPYYRRHAMWLGTLLCWLSLFVASYVSKVQLDLSMVFPAGMTYMSEWFVVRRGLANGVVDAGACLLVHPSLLKNIIAAHGTALTLRYLSYAFLVGMILTLPFFKPRIPERGVRRPTPRSANRSWIMSPYWWLVIGANTLQGFAYFVPLIWLPTFAAELDISASTASLSLALLNSSSLLSRLFFGTLSDFFSPLLLAMLSLSATSLVTFLLWGVAGNAIAGLLVYGFMYGVLAGGWTSLWTGFIRPVAKDDINMYSSLYAILMLSRGLGNVLSTPISTALSTPNATSSTAKVALSLLQKRRTGFEVGEGRYKELIVFTGCCFAGAALVSCTAWGREVMKKSRTSI